MIVGHVIKIFPILMVPGVRLLCSQGPIIGRCPEPEESTPHPHTFFKLYFNVISPSTPTKCLKGSISKKENPTP